MLVLSICVDCEDPDTVLNLPVVWIWKIQTPLYTLRVIKDGLLYRAVQEIQWICSSFSTRLQRVGRMRAERSQDLVLEKPGVTLVEGRGLAPVTEDGVRVTKGSKLFPASSFWRLVGDFIG